MSEKNKKVELNEEELSQVSGGHTRGDAPPETVTAPQTFIIPTSEAPKPEEQFSGFMISVIDKTNQ